MSVAAGRALVLCGLGLLLLTALATLILLYLRVPPGHSPIYGYAPEIGPVFLAAFPYPHWTLSPDAFRRAVIAAILIGWMAFGAAVLLVSRLRQGSAERHRALIVVLAGAAVVQVVLVLLPPVLSQDLYRYALFGKMIADHGLNPLVTPADALAADPMWRYTSWTFTRSHYGPAFLWPAAALTRLAGDDLITTAVLFKTFSALGNLAVAALVLRLARLSGSDGLVPVTLYAWNPLPLLEGAGSGHTEPVMLAFALTGLLLAHRGRPVLATVALVAAAATKYLILPLLPLFVAHSVAAAPPGQRLGRLLRIAAAAAGAAIVLYAPFWAGAATFGEALDHLVRGRALDQTAPAPASPVHLIALAIFAAGALAGTVAAARGPLCRVSELAALLITAFVVLVYPWKVPWYFIPGLALTVAGPRTRTNRALLASSLLLATLATLVYGTVERWSPRASATSASSAASWPASAVACVSCRAASTP